MQPNAQQQAALSAGEVAWDEEVEVDEDVEAEPAEAFVNPEDLDWVGMQVLQQPTSQLNSQGGLSLLKD